MSEKGAHVHNVRSIHYLLCFHHIGPSQNTSFLLPFCYPQMVKNRVLHRGRQKGLKSGRHHDAPWGPYGPPRVPRGGPGEPKSVSKFIKNLSGKGDGKRVWQLSRTGFSAKSVSVVEESLGRKETFIMTMYR